jgi:hypothetical protein
MKSGMGVLLAAQMIAPREVVAVCGWAVGQREARRRVSRRPVAAYSRSVFVNCPYDAEYLPMLQALVFTVHACEFVARLPRKARGQR